MAPAAKRATTLVGLHLLLGVYAASDVSSKLAANAGFPDPLFFACYAIMLALLVVYALGWQQVIKRMPLSSAFANRAVTIVWGVFWGALLFNEEVTVGKLAGAALIVAGVVLFARADAADAAKTGGGGSEAAIGRAAGAAPSADAAGGGGAADAAGGEGGAR